MKKLILLWLVVVMSVGLAVATPQGDETLATIDANPIPPRDVVDLSIRLGGASSATFDIAPRRDYNVGDVEQFIISGTERTSTETMVLAAETEALYIWVSQGLAYDPIDAQNTAIIISEQIMPRLRSIFGTETDVEGDPHIYVLVANNIGSGVLGLFNDADRYPDEIVASSNEINSLMMSGASQLDSQQFLAVFAHEFQHLVQADLDESEETWIIEGIAELGSFLASPQTFGSYGRIQNYIQGSTFRQLNNWNPAAAQDHYAAGVLFLGYITQRLGEDIAGEIGTEPSNGIIGIEHVLATTDAVDSATGQRVGFDDIFADYTVANYLNDPTLENGQFGHSLLSVDERVIPTERFASYPVTFTDATVNQYGTEYIVLDTNAPRTLTIDFAGVDENEILPTTAPSGDYFMWSQRGSQGNARLTGTFDLSDLTSATLSYQTWHDLEEFWDYGYLTISQDGGATWQALPLPQQTDANPFDRAFAAGITGLSGGGASRPAPFIGFSFEAGLRVTAIQPNSPATTSGLRVGDVLLRIDERTLTNANLLNVIDQYAAGDAITLTVLRDGAELDLAVRFAEHPTRTIQAQPRWVQHQIDLTPFVGGEVLVRFDYVTDQALSLDGWALDDVGIPEIGFFDDMEAPNAAWNAEGWVRINNVVPQDYIVQLIEMGATPNVTRLMMSADENRGQWTVNLEANDTAVLVVSGASRITRQAAPYILSVTSD